MSFYRYYQTLGEAGNALATVQRQRALRRQIVLEVMLLLAIALIALLIAARPVWPDASHLALGTDLPAILHGWLQTAKIPGW